MNQVGDALQAEFYDANLFRAGNSFGPRASKPAVHRCPGFGQQKAELQGQGELLLSGGHLFHLVQLGGGHVVQLVHGQLGGGHVLQP